MCMVWVSSGCLGQCLAIHYVLAYLLFPDACFLCCCTFASLLAFFPGMVVVFRGLVVALIVCWSVLFSKRWFIGVSCGTVASRWICLLGCELVFCLVWCRLCFVYLRSKCVRLMCHRDMVYLISGVARGLELLMPWLILVLRSGGRPVLGT